MDTAQKTAIPQSLHRHSTVTAQSPHSTVTAQSLTAQSQYSHSTVTTQSQHSHSHTPELAPVATDAAHDLVEVVESLDQRVGVASLEERGLQATRIRYSIGLQAPTMMQSAGAPSRLQHTARLGVR